MRKAILFIIAVQLLRNIQVFGRDFCFPISLSITCDRSMKYRPITNICNNLKKPFLGSSNTKLGRLVKSRYSDGISSPPKSITGAELPNVRLISLNIFRSENIQNSKYTDAMMEFLQFVAHDISNIMNIQPEKGCCSENGKLEADPDDRCFPIMIPPNDTIHLGKECMNLVRTLTDIDLNCQSSQSDSANQINLATASLDLSMIYGSSHDKIKLIRSFVNGQLRVENRYNMTWPQRNPDGDNVCFVKEPRETCYMGGDQRINQHPLLSIYTTLFIREHNRLANELNKINPAWTDEKLFQESRRINIAQFQYIGFYEWFTSIVGIEGIKKMGFAYMDSGGEYVNDYDESLDISTFNEFTTGVFRLPHTLINGKLRMVSETNTVEKILKLSDTYNRPKFIEEDGNFEKLLRGMLLFPSHSFDSNYDEEIRSFLFKHNQTYGSDLKAIDIQRDRDHGVGSYNDLREFCGLKRAENWEDFLDLINETHVNSMRNFYADVNDVDLTVGSALEKPFQGTIIGLTYICLLKIQIRSLRSGDRFWFENSDPAIRFTNEQLAELRTTRFSRIICENGGNIQSISKIPFLLPSATNTFVKCSDLKSLNMSVFKD